MKKVTLLFLLRDDAIVLAMKKRGHGEGLWNGVGGKVEPGETVEAAVVRECQEEIGVTPVDIKPIGRLAFYQQDKPDFSHDIHIFSATQWEGEPHETEEMRPEWFKISEIPYDRMWADDRLWLPHLIAGTSFSGSATLDLGGAIVHAEIKPGVVQ